MSDPDWGSEHCGDRWRAHVQDATGFDLTSITGPSPRRRREWVSMMRRLNARDLAGVISAVHGQPYTSVRLAKRGDIARMGWAIGIVRGELAEFFGGVTVPIGNVDQAWPIAR